MALSVQEPRRFTFKALMSSEVKEEVLGDKNFLVVPSVILTEGVLFSSNATVPALALASEFGLVPESWNGRPITFNHPEFLGNAVSANEPNRWEQDVIGQVFSTRLDGDKLKADLWLNRDKLPDEIMGGLEDEIIFEVSTGIFTLEEPSSGTFNGKPYEVIWRNILPDHLAILPRGVKGACSVKDGCGAPRINLAQMRAPMVINSGSKTNPNSNSKINPNSKTNSNSNSKTNSVLPTLTASRARQIATSFLDAVGLRVNELSAEDKANAVEMGLSAILGEVPFSIVAMFDTRVVYAVLDLTTLNWTLEERSFQVEEGGEVTIGAEVQKVRPETQFVPLIFTDSTSTSTSISTSMETNMTNSDLASADDATSVAPVAPVAPVANTTSATSVANATPACDCAQSKTTPAPATQSATATQPASTAQSETAVDNIETWEQFRLQKSGMSPQLIHQIDDALAYTANRRKELITKLSSKGDFSQEELEGLSTTFLAKLNANTSKNLEEAGTGTGTGKLAEKTDFSGNGGAPTTNTRKDAGYTPPTPVFAVK